MEFVPWQIWFMAGIFLLVAEIFTAGFALAGAGIGCLASALVAWLGLGFSAQSFTFFIVSVVFFYTVKPLVERSFYPRAGAQKTNVAALPGQRGRVIERIDLQTGSGRVLVGGEDWKATSEFDDPLEINESVEVISVVGTRLIVRKYRSEGDRNG